MLSHKFKSNFTTKFEYSQAKSSKTHKISVIYLHGLCSDPWGRRQDSMKTFCLEHGLDFFRFELVGYGSDSDNYEQADIGIWKAQLLEVIDEMLTGQVILVGSSAGGWISFLAAIERPERVKGIIGLAAAPDFIVDLWNVYFNDAQKQEVEQNGKIAFGNKDYTYIFTKKLIQSGQQHIILDKQIPVACPVHLLQGMKDASLPWKKAIQIAERLESGKVVVKLLKDSNHRLQNPEDVEELFNSILSLSA